MRVVCFIFERLVCISKYYGNNRQFLLRAKIFFSPCVDASYVSYDWLEHKTKQLFAVKSSLNKQTLQLSALLYQVKLITIAPSEG